jgi:hypothetical protein
MEVVKRINDRENIITEQSNVGERFFGLQTGTTTLVTGNPSAAAMLRQQLTTSQKLGTLLKPARARRVEYRGVGTL